MNQNRQLCCVENCFHKNLCVHINMFRLYAISAKEGAAAGISKVVGTDITDTTLRTTDGQDFKTVDECTFYALIWAVIEGAELPATMDVRKLYVSL